MAQEQGEIRRDADPAMLARYLLATMAGLRTMVKAALPTNEIEQIVELALKALQ